MSATEIAESETERDRLSSEFGAGWEAGYGPGTSGCHELLDRLSMLAEMLDRYLVRHPACVARPDWHALAEGAAASLQELYQQVGAEHLAAESSNA